MFVAKFKRLIFRLVSYEMANIQGGGGGGGGGGGELSTGEKFPLPPSPSAYIPA